MKRGGTIVAFDSDKLRVAVKEAGFRSLRSFALDIQVDPTQLAHAIKRGRCYADLLFAMERGLGIDEDALLTDATQKSRPRYWRQRKGMSVNQLSKKSGVSTSIIHRLERGDGDCYCFSAACLAKALEVPMGVYLGYEN